MTFDEIFVKAKDVFETAYKKADDVMSVQKQKFDLTSLENKLAKDYETLGRLCYEEIKAGALAEKSELSALAEEISSKENQVEELKKEILKAKNKKRCPNCDAAIDKNSNFCNACGQKFVSED